MKSERSWGRLGMKFETYSLGELVSIKYGKNQKKVLSENGAFPIYGTGGLMGYATKALYDKPSVLIGRKGTIEKIRYVNHPFWTVDTLFYTIVNDNIVIPQFLYYAMLQLDLLQYNEGTTIPSLRTETLNRIELRIPNIDNQKRILHYLATIDEKIVLNTKINENLEQQYLTVIDEKLSNINDYEIKPLSEVADCQNGRAFYKDGYDIDGALVVDLGNVNTSGNFIFTNSDKFISIERYNDCKLEKYRVYKDDLVMVMTDRKSTMKLLGKVGKIYKPGYYLLNQRMYRIRAKKSINANYLYAFLNSTAVHKVLKEKALGTVQKYVNTGDINTLEIVIPPPRVMQEISEMINPIFLQMENNILENENLNNLLDTLLPKLMSGEIDVSQVKI